MPMILRAPVTGISRGSIHDGPGIRTVVYFMGCGLRCRWCHNPETLSDGNQVLFAPSKCIGCGRCIALCPECHFLRGGVLCFDRTRCRGCMRCTQACPSGALQNAAESKTPAELMAEILKDRHYYEQSGGGATLSGGECLLRKDFVLQLLAACRQEGINTAVESALFVPTKTVEEVSPLTDVFFADLKIADPEKHRRFTGESNELIVKNLRFLASSRNQLTIRIPLIPGVNDSEEDFRGFAELLSSFGKGVIGVELLRYNPLAESKYAQLGREYVSFSEQPQSDGQMQQAVGRLSGLLSGGVPVFFRSER